MLLTFIFHCFTKWDKVTSNFCYCSMCIVHSSLFIVHCSFSFSAYNNKFYLTFITVHCSFVFYFSIAWGKLAEKTSSITWRNYLDGSLNFSIFSFSKFIFSLFLLFLFFSEINNFTKQKSQKNAIWSFFDFFIFFHYFLIFSEEKVCSFLFSCISFKYFLLLALESEFYCFLRSRCSMEMWCPDDTGWDKWDWVGPPAWGKVWFNSAEWILFAC